jgi:hypothetical protein
MGRHSVPRSRRKPSAAVAAVAAPYALLLAAGGDLNPFAMGGHTDQPADRVVDDTTPSGVEVVAAEPTDFSSTLSSAESAVDATPVQFASASRYRVYNREADRVLPVGVAPERSLQVKTILVARSVSALFPEIHTIGGWRPDALRWHPNGLAVDIMIPNPSSPEGIALGYKIVEFALENADRFDLQDCIWRGVYYTPGGGARPGGYGHYDHVHITTHGGGYPTGNEVYIR